MLEEKNGKIIDSIKFNKKDISICFENGEILKISEGTFTYFYLYKDKVVSLDEYQDIINYENLNKARQYVLNLLSKSYYTEKEILSRLIEKKHISYKDANLIIDYLKEHNLINDKRYLLEYVESLHYKNYGKNKILQKCYDEGFKKEEIEKLVFDEDEEKYKAEIQIRKYLSSKEKNYQKLKENGYAFLLNQGFDFEICSYAIKIVDDVYDFSKEKELLHRELIKYLRTHSIDINNNESKQKLINVFIRRGYKFEDISNEIKGVYDDEVC